MSKKILLVDDEKDILEFLSYNLKKEGYKVYTEMNGKSAFKTAKKIVPNLIVLDVMMPEIDGIETCTKIREVSKLDETLIVFLSARAEDYSQLAGLDAGADAYITKPINPTVFVSKIKALLKRFDKKHENDNETIKYKALKIDKTNYLVTYKKKELSLPKKEFQLLFLLASNPGKIFTRDEIYSKIWGEDVVVGDRTIDVHIRKLREKINEDYIKTVKGVGYKFIK